MFQKYLLLFCSFFLFGYRKGAVVIHLILFRFHISDNQLKCALYLIRVRLLLYLYCL